MCRYYGIKRSTYIMRVKHGISMEDALTSNSFPRIHPRRPVNRNVSDHLGNHYSSIRAMCDHYGIKISAYYSRLKSGWELSEILTTVVDDRHNSVNHAGNPCVDHLGNQYPSIMAMCDHYGIQAQRYHSRIAAGWPLDEILLTAQKHGFHKPCVDHLGNRYPSVKSMCDHYGIKQNTYYTRLSIGWSIEDALTKNVRHRVENSKCTKND